MNSLLHIGTSGWSYKDWLGNFYPPALPQGKWLEHYATQFTTVEVDSTFYAIPPRERFERWAEIAPEGFEFALKVPQVITHEKSLCDCDAEMKQFLDSASALGEHLGPVLFQFPYSFKPERQPDLLEYLDALPRHDFRFVVEVRNRAWFRSNLIDELTSRNLVLCLVDHPWMPRVRHVTGSFIYMRFLGDQEKIIEFGERQVDRTKDLEYWAAESVGWLRKEFPVYGYFNNHFSGHAPTDAKAFLDILQKFREESPVP